MKSWRALRFTLRLPTNVVDSTRAPMRPENSVPLVRAQEVDATFDRRENRSLPTSRTGISNRRSASGSEPEGAQFLMLIGTNEKTARRTATQNDLKSVWRGRYAGTMSKKGYRDVAEFEIDLFNSNDTTVRCTLVPKPLRRTPCPSAG